MEGRPGKGSSRWVGGCKEGEGTGGGGTRSEVEVEEGREAEAEAEAEVEGARRGGNLSR